MTEQQRKNLLELSKTARSAANAYYSHTKPKYMSDDERLQFDIDEAKMCRANVLAQSAYRAALDRFTN